MTITLVVEDGTIVDDANSYNSLDDIRAYAALRNIELSDDDEIVKGHAILAMDYLEAQDYLADRTLGLLQALEWPRTGVIVGADTYDDDYIPPNLIAAQARLCIDIKNGITLLPSYVTVDRVSRKTIGPVTTEWFDTPGVAPILSAVDALLAPLLASGGYGLRTVRI